VARYLSVFVLSDEFLVACPGTIQYWSADPTRPHAETWSITVPLAAFSADDGYDPSSFKVGAGGPEIIETALDLESIRIPAKTLSDLSDRTFTFPVNPEGNYIDASIYLGGGHCPVDVTLIEFGRSSKDRIAANLHVSFDFEAEAVAIGNRTAVLSAELHTAT
jgi:hypothetical protein